MDKKKEIAITATRSILGGIPYFGTALNESIFEHRSRIKQKRINDFIESLSEYIDGLDIESPKTEHIQSEEFGDVFESIIRKVSENRSKEKAERFKLILANQLVNPSNSDFTDTYLDIISKLSEKQFEILIAHSNVKPKVKELQGKIKKAERDVEELKTEAKNLRIQAYNGTIEGSIAEADLKVAKAELNLKKLMEISQQTQLIRQHTYYSIEKGEFMFCLQDLVAKSLLTDVGIGAISTPPYSVMEITEFGKGLLDFISDKNK